MNRTELDRFIEDVFGVRAEILWQSQPSFAVYRHSENRKWFAVIMDIPKEKLGLLQKGNVSVVNLKCDPIMTGALISDEGIHRAYHMNKNHWITVRLDGSVQRDKVLALLDISFDLTK